MKIKEGYIVGQIAGENVVLPSGDNLDLSVMVTLNDTAKFLWEKLQEEKSEDDLLKDVIAAYGEVDQVEVRSYIKEFVSMLKEYDFLI